MSSSSGPIQMLHRHALESVLGFLSLAEVGGAMSVAHHWSAAALTMRRLECSVNFVVPCESRLSRHISSLSAECSVADLELIARRMPHLTSLYCRLQTLPLLGDPLLIFPSSISTLQIDLLDEEVVADVERCNALICSVSRVPLLKKFLLETVLPCSDQLSLAPLANCCLLEELSVENALGYYSDMQLRDMLALPSLVACGIFVYDEIRRLLLYNQDQSPRWKTLNFSGSAQNMSSLISASSLSCSITTLAWHMRDNGVDYMFVHQLHNLQDLVLNRTKYIITSSEAEQTLVALQKCTKLTSLKMTGIGFTSSHLCNLLPCLGHLRTLHLLGHHNNNLESLRCFSRGPITRTLTELTLSGCKHPLLHTTELEHVHALRELRRFKIDDSFAEPLDAFALRCYSNPCSLLLPKLTKFSYCRGNS